MNAAEWEEARRVTAEHEAAHAIAYLARGLTFDYVSVEECLTAGSGRSISREDRAYTALAGPVIEMREGSALYGDPTWGLNVLDRAAEDALEVAAYRADPEGDDMEGAAGYVEALLPSVAALVHVHHDVITEVAEAALKRDPLPYEGVIAIVGDRDLSVPEENLVDAMIEWEEHRDRLEILDGLLVEAYLG